MFSDLCPPLHIQPLQRKPEPPWQFALAPIPAEIDGEPNHRDDDSVTRNEKHDGTEAESSKSGSGQLQDYLPVKKLYCHILDWYERSHHGNGDPSSRHQSWVGPIRQAPRNHIFVPKWMMQT